MLYGKTKKQLHENPCISVINSCIIVKLCAEVAHEKPIPHTKQNSEISTDVIDDNVIMLKFEHLHQKATLKGCISVVCG